MVVLEGGHMFASIGLQHSSLLSLSPQQRYWQQLLPCQTNSTNWHL